MQRRQLLRTLPPAALAGVAGCLGDGDPGDGTDTTTDQQTTTTTDESRGVYVQSFYEGMAKPGTASVGDYTVALLAAVPHTFWTLTGTDRSEHQKEESDTLHLMVQVWDDETGQVMPESGVSVEIEQDGELVSEEVIYPMLSQRMGFHYGANFGLPGDGDYTVRVSAAPMRVDRLGGFAGRFDTGGSGEIEFTLDDRLREQLTIEELDQAGDPGAIRPMEMGDMPVGVAASAEELPGTTVGTRRVDDADLLLKYDEADLADGGAYLYVSARTPYNDLVLPMMSLDATVTRDGESVYDGELTRAIHPDLQYHYGAQVDGVQSGDEVELSVVMPPQVARHEGYESAFLRMDGATFTV